MSLPVVARARVSLCFPRVSGDEPDPHAWLTWKRTFSPRERG